VVCRVGDLGCALDRAVRDTPHNLRSSFRLVLIADRDAAPRVRRALRCWLCERGWPPDEGDDVVLAVDEAVTNVVAHAYPDGATGSASVLERPVSSPRRVAPSLSSRSPITACGTRWARGRTDRSGCT
jgi:hypothetical protein